GASIGVSSRILARLEELGVDSRSLEFQPTKTLWQVLATRDAEQTAEFLSGWQRALEEGAPLPRVPAGYGSHREVLDDFLAVTLPQFGRIDGRRSGELAEQFVELDLHVPNWVWVRDGLASDALDGDAMENAAFDLLRRYAEADDATGFTAEFEREVAAHGPADSLEMDERTRGMWMELVRRDLESSTDLFRYWLEGVEAGVPLAEIVGGDAEARQALDAYLRAMDTWRGLDPDTVVETLSSAELRALSDSLSLP
ncbi:MAG: hypothetical protein AAFY60_18230, partial [Myxococcota bacterium]